LLIVSRRVSARFRLRHDVGRGGHLPSRRRLLLWRRPIRDSGLAYCARSDRHALTAFTTAKFSTKPSDSDPPDRFSTATLNDPAATALIQ
jgi:hypothetical protein